MTTQDDILAKLTAQEQFVYHRTDILFTTFDLGKTEVGLHVAGFEQSMHADVCKRLDSSDKTIIWKIDFHPRKLIRLNDRHEWTANNVARDLHSLGVLDTDEYDKIRYQPKNEIPSRSEILRSILSTKGIDGIVYLDKVETPSTYLTGWLGKSDEKFRKRFPDAEDSFIITNLQRVRSAIPFIVDESI